MRKKNSKRDTSNETNKHKRNIVDDALNCEAEEKKPRPISVTQLESLGYRLTRNIVSHPSDPAWIVEIERSDDGTTADFCFCFPDEGDPGYIMEGSLEFHGQNAALAWIGSLARK